LIGLKENVIVGRLIPAGTGSATFDIKRVATLRDSKIIAQRQEEAIAVAALEDKSETKSTTVDISDVFE
jgi:DNA-directed RNA polymerase subunit beta'